MSARARERAVCHCCGALEGELHEYGCQIEPCPFCGRQLISCGCCYDHLRLRDYSRYGADTNGLPPDTYGGGLDSSQEAEWLKILEAKGRVPWIEYPNFCAKCGKAWPKIFMVPDEEWERYVEPSVQGKMLCRSCYLWIKGTIDQYAGRGEDERL